MPNHQERRRPLPADYQHPTHGVDCDCVTCRENARIAQMIFEASKLPRLDDSVVARVMRDLRPLEPTAETPWAV